MHASRDHRPQPRYKGVRFTHRPVSLQQLMAVAVVAIVLAGCGSGPTDESAAAGPNAATADGRVPATVRSLIARTLEVDENRVTPGASFAGDLDADELDMVELVMAYERAFKVEISDEDASRFKQVQDVVTYLQKRNAKLRSE